MEEVTQATTAQFGRLGFRLRRVKGWTSPCCRATRRTGGHQGSERLEERLRLELYAEEVVPSLE